MVERRLDGKVALVTGAARGLGRAYARRLATLGARVYALDINPDGAALFDEGPEDEEARRLDGMIEDVKIDLVDRAQVDAVFTRIAADAGGIDILVNNAGGAIAPPEHSSAAATMPEADVRLILDVNLMTAIHGCQAVVPFMVARGGGVIVNTSSIAGRIVAMPDGLAHYSVAKAALTHYTRCLAAQVGPSGIRVNCIAPGTILTGRAKKLVQGRGSMEGAAAAVPLRRLGETEDCANVIEFLVTDQSSYITGQCISVCGGMALTPA